MEPENVSGQSYTAAGKTGTAEFSTSSKASHAWFVGYAHREDKEDIAVAVIVEDSDQAVSMRFQSQKDF